MRSFALMIIFLHKEDITIVPLFHSLFHVKFSPQILKRKTKIAEKSIIIIFENFANKVLHWMSASSFVDFSLFYKLFVTRVVNRGYKFFFEVFVKTLKSNFKKLNKLKRYFFVKLISKAKCQNSYFTKGKTQL